MLSSNLVTDEQLPGSSDSIFLSVKLEDRGRENKHPDIICREEVAVILSISLGGQRSRLLETV